MQYITPRPATRHIFKMKALHLILSIFLFSIARSGLATSEKNDVVNKEAPMDQDEDQGDMKEEVVDLNGVMVDCNDTFTIPMGYIQALNESGSFPDETDKTAKCYVRCVLERTLVASAEGQYDPARTALVFGDMRKGKREDIEAIAKTCVDRQETCKCEKAYAYMKCLIQQEIENSSDT